MYRTSNQKRWIRRWKHHQKVLHRREIEKNNEFRPELDFNANLYMSLNPTQRKQYQIDLAIRRRRAHDEDIEHEDRHL